jgi:predicted phage baseplate assembly protein
LEKQETHLSIGQQVAVTGTIVDESNQDLGISRSEVAIIAEISMDAYASTIIKFRDNLKNSYQLQSVIINANVAKATHGHTKSVALGGGDPSKKMQSFILREKPLTFVSFPNERGVKSTLEIYVDDIKWREVPSLNEVSPFDRAFVTRVDNDSQVHIFFGDGLHGKLPNAGLDNIRAQYRIGTGLAGIAKTGQVSILLDRPAGVKNVTNPVPAGDAADPETIDKGRENAPLTVLTLGRIVSLIDYENFASAFAGVGKAHATWIWSSDERIIYLTVASETASPVEPTSDLYKSLISAINRFKDPTAKFQIGDFVTKLFNIQAEM